MRDKRIEILGPGRDKWRSDSEKQGGGEGSRNKNEAYCVGAREITSVQNAITFNYFTFCPDTDVLK